jgi:hypothetical protein
MTDMTKLIARGREIGKRAATIAAIEVADVVAQELPGAVVEATEVGVKVAGKGLLRRVIEGAAVRGLGILMRAART